MSPWLSRPATEQAKPLLVELDSNTPEPKRRLLISKSQKTSPAPDHAQYFSSENQRVAQETRARPLRWQDLQSPSLRKSLTRSGPALEDRSESRPTSTSPSNPSYSARSELQELQDSSLPWGAQNLLNTVENVHYSFYSRIYESLAPIWRSYIRRAPLERSLSPGEYRVIANLVLDSAGNLLDVEFQERSDIPYFNEAVRLSAAKVARFPNPPKSLIGPDHQVRTRWSFTVNVDENALFRLAPPRRLDAG
ncbi:MAG: hypothetical protein RJB38_410 [Pseudomonadota bacterium]